MLAANNQRGDSTGTTQLWETIAVSTDDTLTEIGIALGLGRPSLHNVWGPPEILEAIRGLPEWRCPQCQTTVRARMADGRPRSARVVGPDWEGVSVPLLVDLALVRTEAFRRVGELAPLDDPRRAAFMQYGVDIALRVIFEMEEAEGRARQH